MTAGTWWRLAATALAFAATNSPALAQTAKIDGADTAWMIVATGIVLMMTLPGLALFYAGMVRKKNVLATMAQCFKYDDSLDVFGVHGIGGATGTLLCGIFATAAVSVSPGAPRGLSGLLEGNPMQLLTQLYGVAITALWCGLATYGLLRLVGFFSPLRASPEDEMAGLDISLHGEALQ
jgi:ammonia channel protein AmtB